MSKQLKFIKQLNKQITKKNTALLLVSLFILLLFGSLIKTFFVIILFLFVISLSGLVARMIPKYGICIELMMFCTVIASYVLGAKVGVLIAFFGVLLYSFFSGNFSPEIIIFIPLYILIALLVPFFTFIPIISLGIALAIIYAIISAFLSFFLLGVDIVENTIFVVVNSFLNYVLFMYFAEIVVALI